MKNQGGINMKTKKQPVCDCFIETDRMINEGLGNGTINPKYSAVHARLKEKQDMQLLSALHEKKHETGGWTK